MSKSSILTAISLFLCTCTPITKPEYVSSNFNLRSLADGVYACIHKIGGKAICNVGIIDNGEETIIFDTFLSPEVAKEILQVVAHYELSPIKYVVNSHFHNDHIRGNQVFDSKVKIISTEKTQSLIKENEPIQLAYEEEFADERYLHYDSLAKAYSGDTASREYKQIMMWLPYYKTLSISDKEVKTRIPDITFTNELRLDGSQRKVMLISKGKGHTESDLILYLPDDKIIFTGDLVFNNCHPYLGHGYPVNWKTWLREMASLDISIVIPGHGEPGNLQTIYQMGEYIEDVENLALTMIQDKLSIDQSTAVDIPEPYKSWWFDRFFAPNLMFMYNQQTTSQE